MTGLYYPELVDVLTAAGVDCAVADVNAGWETRARSSGGFPAAPLAVFWHHTASSASPADDLAYMIHGSDDAPVGNMLLDRDGVVWPIAAGASNCAGKGGPSTFSRGTIPADQGNTHGWQIEAANDGVGEAWPTAQIDAYYAASNALSALFGNLPGDVIGHAHYTFDAGGGYRKIDPATAAAVAGAWCPSSINTSGTWNLDDIRAECTRRASTAVPQPETPDHNGDPDMLHIVVLDAAGNPTRGPAIVGPGYWHYAHSDDQAFVWQKLYGPPRQLDNDYDFDTVVRTIALEPDDGTQLGAGG